LGSTVGIALLPPLLLVLLPLQNKKKKEMKKANKITSCRGKDGLVGVLMVGGLVSVRVRPLLVYSSE